MKPIQRYLLPIAMMATAAYGQTADTITYSYSGLPLPIFVDSANIVTVANIVVPRALKMTTVTTKIQIDYPAIGDLNLFLYSPDGTRVKILERNCGMLQNVDTTFADSAESTFSSFCPSEAGRGPFKANEPLSNFQGADSSLGTWRLAAENNGSDTRIGWLTNFSLTISGTRQITPTLRSDTILNSASLRTSGIAPGEVISIFGIGLGPTAGVYAPAGAAWPTTLASTRVTVNGADVPLGFSSMFRVDAQLPFTLAPGADATIQVRFGDLASSTVMVPVQAAAPGVYSLEAGGSGQIKAINSNGQLNSTVTPADRGSMITIYASGLGAVSPDVAAGQVPPNSPTSSTTEMVTATVGGYPATVLFAGLAPGFPGLYQVNLTVPTGVPAGSREVVLSTGGSSSQSSLFLSVQ